jgi:hypothetical protein
MDCHPTKIPRLDIQAHSEDVENDELSPLAALPEDGRFSNLSVD